MAKETTEKTKTMSDEATQDVNIFLSRQKASIDEFKKNDDGEKKNPRFHMIGNSGVPFKHWYYGNLGIDLEGIKIPDLPMAILRDHDTSRIVGKADSIQITERGLEVVGDISLSTADGQEVYKLSKEGFPWESSVRIEPLQIVELTEKESTEVNGHTISGPGAIITKSELMESSFCVFGADRRTPAEALKKTQSNQKEANKMPEEVTISTVEELGAAYPELCAQLIEEETESVDEALEQIKASIDEATDRERERVLKIMNAMVFDSQLEIIKAAIEDGTPAEDAVIKLGAHTKEHVKTLRATSETPPAGMYAAAPDETPEPDAPVEPDTPEQLAAAEYKANEALYKKLGVKVETLVAGFKHPSTAMSEELLTSMNQK